MPAVPEVQGAAPEEAPEPAEALPLESAQLVLDPRPIGVSSQLILRLQSEDWHLVRDMALNGTTRPVPVYTRHRGSYALASHSSLLSWLAASLTGAQLHANIDENWCSEAPGTQKMTKNP